MVVSVDTSLVHMCGSLGRECWMLQPLKETDFRWGDSSMGEDNIWYPSVRIIRNPGSWTQTFKIIMDKLKNHKAQAWKTQTQRILGELHAHSIKA